MRPALIATCLTMACSSSDPAPAVDTTSGCTRGAADQDAFCGKRVPSRPEAWNCAKDFPIDGEFAGKPIAGHPSCVIYNDPIVPSFCCPSTK